MKFIIAVSIVQILVFNAEIQHSETFGKINEFRVLEINSLFEIRDYWFWIYKILNIVFIVKTI